MTLLEKTLICLLLFALPLIMSGCGGHTTRVIDTPETRELEGWQKPYEVDGQRYDPLRDHQGFEQRGIASWYGGKFHGRKTSNGETYDMYGLSAAHKTLPMGVYVKVTHLGTGREVTVRINDRGPFVAGRIVDLSYGAARQLGIVDSGTAQVRLVALGYPQQDHGKTTYRAPVSYDAGTFAVQIGAFSAAENASDWRRACVPVTVRRSLPPLRSTVGRCTGSGSGSIDPWTRLNRLPQGCLRMDTREVLSSPLIETLAVSA